MERDMFVIFTMFAALEVDWDIVICAHLFSKHCTSKISLLSANTQLGRIALGLGMNYKAMYAWTVCVQ
jgi:hypothetical protein